MVNGDDVVAFPTLPNPGTQSPVGTMSRSPTNIADNVAGWDGGGVSMQDALKVAFVNNTVVANDTTASAGVLFNTLGAPLSATPPPGCTLNTTPNDPSQL